MKHVQACCLVALLCVLVALPTTAQQAPSPDSVGLQNPESSANLASNIVPGHNFDGIGQNSFGYTDPFIPPDPAGAVGTTQYIEWVNTSLAVFNKGTGEIISGPTPGNQVWTSMGGPCATYNDGQPVVQFDKLASRWVIGQLVLHGPPYYFCVAVSATPDATGSYYLYSVQFNDVPDSPRLGTWPDAYYVTFNMYRGGTFLYANVCALDRSSMLNGQPPRGPLCQQTSSQYSSLLPSDLDGTMGPPSGSPNFLFSLGQNALNFWYFSVDFSQGTSQLSGPIPIPVQPFSPACSNINCIDQRDTSNRLTALSDRLMYRAAYRNFGGHESLTLNHTIIFALRYASVRWYELRNLSSLMPTVYQQGTYVPTFIHRWMGNVAMDNLGDIVAAYNFSSRTLHPSFSFTDRLASDPPNQFRGENLEMQATGSQTAGSAWGNSTSLSVDPVDDCTFWATGEYLRADGTNNWNTRIGSFSLSSCPSSNLGIQITGAPDYGTDDKPLSGTVSNISPGDYGNYKVGVLLFISGVGWWSKPYCDELFVPIQNGNWMADVGTGGMMSEDYSAVKYVAYLLPQSATGACQQGIDGLPQDLETQALARAYLDRPNPQRRTITFAGLNWDVTANTFGPINPGPCIFSDSTNNVFLDSSGNLHLKIVQNAEGTWTCSEIVPRVNDQLQQEQRYGYGTYTYYLASAVNNLDPNAVVGLFTWSNDPAYAGPFQPWENNPQGGVGGHSELDVEFSQGLTEPPSNAQFCVQPYTSNPCHQFTMPAGYNNSTAIINWFPDGINFQVQDPNGNVLASYNYSGAVPPPADNGGWNGFFPSPQQARLNLWVIGGSPQNGQDVEVVISGFTYVPYSQ